MRIAHRTATSIEPNVFHAPLAAAAWRGTLTRWVASILIVLAVPELRAGEFGILNEKFVKAGGRGATSVSFSPNGRVLVSNNGRYYSPAIGMDWIW